MYLRNMSYLCSFHFLPFKTLLFKKLKSFVIVFGLIFVSSCGQSNKMDNLDQTDPPPIIIKSGSFIIESTNELKESGGSSGSPFVYKLPGFTLKSVNICVIDYLKPEMTCTPFQNPVVKIWLTKHMAPAASPDFTIQQNGSDLDMSIYVEKKLKFKESSHSKRKFRYEDDDDKKSINIEKIEVNGTTFNSGDEIQFLLGIYN